MAWNCRGAGNNRFKANFDELISNHRPEIVALFETKVCLSSMDMYFNNKGFTAATFVNPIGRVGGIWLLWDPTQVTVHATRITNQAIHAFVSKYPFEEWLLFAVYTSPNPRVRDELWEDLENQAQQNPLPWCAIGDYNDISSSSERKSSSPDPEPNRSRRFMDRINNCNLIDMGSSGLNHMDKWQTRVG